MRDVLVQLLGTVPVELRRTLTWDQGKQMARHLEVAAALRTTAIFFCQPPSPWQRASNENTNGLLREYFPKGTDLAIDTTDPNEQLAGVSARAEAISGAETDRASSRRANRCSN